MPSVSTRRATTKPTLEPAKHPTQPTPFDLAHRLDGGAPRGRDGGTAWPARVRQHLFIFIYELRASARFTLSLRIVEEDLLHYRVKEVSTLSLSPKSGA